jgi:polysaccharide deacetylase 2 family uncharacterized protein YibQ
MAELKRLPLWITALLVVMMTVLFFALGARVQHQQARLSAPAPEVTFEEPARPEMATAKSPVIAETPLQKPPQMPLIAVAGPGIALIIDDVGYNLKALSRILKLDVPVSISVLPDSPYAARAATMAHQAGQLVMLHLPMQPLTPKYRNHMTDAFLRVEMSDNELRRTFARDLSQVPFAEGVNNHMGSHLTQLEKPMRQVMALCQEQGLFFVDSITSGKSVAASLASEMGLAWASRRIFLDHNINQSAMLEAWRMARACANAGGQCIVIAHPHPETLAFLETHLSGDDLALIQPLRGFLKVSK